jgi:hypothetical protein
VTETGVAARLIAPGAMKDPDQSRHRHGLALAGDFLQNSGRRGRVKALRINELNILAYFACIGVTSQCVVQLIR